MPGGYHPNFVHCPSETTSTEPSTTLMAVCSSMAYAGTPMSAAHRSASARVFSGKASRCGKIEKSTTPRVRSSSADGHLTKSAPIRGVITMLPALTPTQTVSGSEGSRSASPDSRIQWHKYVASPPSTRRTSASRIQGTHRSAPIVGSAVSSRTPRDAQPRPEKCRNWGSAATRPRTDAGPHIGWPHWAVGTTSAWHSAIGLPRSCTSAEWMLGFVTPPDVSKRFKVPPRFARKVDVPEDPGPCRNSSSHASPTCARVRREETPDRTRERSVMTDLTGKKVAIIATDHFEEAELVE